jgi:translocation protein SEC72
MWPRARRFGNVYAFATVDTLFAVLWFSAWVAIASYVAQGKSEGKDESDQQDDNTNDDEKASGCDNWKYGSASKCNVSTASCIIGVVILYVLRAPGLWTFANLAF